MLKYIGHIFICICVAVTFNLLAYVIKSDFISTFPGADFLTIMLTLLAINIATSSFIVSKLEEITADKPFSFSKTYSSIKNSILEQVILVGLAFILLMLRSSQYITSNDLGDKYLYASFTINTLLTAVFIMVITILWDTGKSIFSIVKKK